MLAATGDSAFVQPLVCNGSIWIQRDSSLERGLKRAQICYLILQRQELREGKNPSDKFDLKANNEPFVASGC